ATRCEHRLPRLHLSLSHHPRAECVFLQLFPHCAIQTLHRHFPSAQISSSRSASPCKRFCARFLTTNLFQGFPINPLQRNRSGCTPSCVFSFHEAAREQSG